MLNKAKRCIDCIYYPKDCGYWDEIFRKKNDCMEKDAEHNCQDFSKDYVKYKYGLEIKY